MRKSTTSKLAVLAATSMALALLVFSPVAYAGGPFSNPGTGTAYQDPTHQDPNWVALKNAYRIRSGIQPGQGKGAMTHPFVASTALPQVNYPPSYELSTSNPVPNTFEPGDGCSSSCFPPHFNFTGSLTTSDDAGSSYSAPNFFNMCGPAAADNALYYWPAPPNFLNNPNVYDNWDGATTTWNAVDVDNINRMRGYMMKLAWQIHAPSWSSGANGMMNAQPRSSAVWLQVVRDGLNWEASGENSSNWSNYFYVVQWWNQATHITLHNDIVSDLYDSNVPVVAEVNAQLMPNWTNLGGFTNHFITIVGYNDNNSTYQYTDTCAKLTGCGSNTTAGVNSATQNQLWNAIINIPVNQGTGDGGWVW